MDIQNTPYIQGTVCYEQISLNQRKRQIQVLQVG